jgi:hypothetical protein
MPTKKTKKAERKQWWTTAIFNREGALIPLPSNFSARYCSERILLEDLEHGMRTFHGPRGVYATLVWPGQVTALDALHRVPPKFTVWENGTVHVHT